MKNDQTYDASPKPAHITIFPRGPMRIDGDYELRDTDGCLIETNGNTNFCRCGNSKNKPFCDKSHERVGWPTDDGF